jgi:integrase/recombinase XerD
MPYKLQTLINKISTIPNSENAKLVGEFDSYLRDIGKKDRYRKNQLLSLIPFCHYLAEKHGPDFKLIDINDSKVIRAFLDTKEKPKDVDPDERWRVTWNAYLDCIKYFYRWVASQRGKQEDIPTDLWQTPPFAQIRRKKIIHETYETEEIWEDQADVLLVAKYADLPDKVALTFTWDSNGRPDEVAKTEWHHIMLREAYGEGEIPADTKTGTRPVLLTLSFPYIRDWKNQYPFPYHPRGRIVCNMYNGAAITSDTIYKRFAAIKKRIAGRIERDEIKDPAEKERLKYLVATKAWNPYCFRHSSIDYDMGELPEFAVRKKVGWTLTSRQPGRYGKRRMNQNIKVQLLASRAGIVLEEDGKSKKPTNKTCPRCQVLNSLEVKHCSKCGYPLSFEALEEIKAKERESLDQQVKDLVRRQFEDLMEERHGAKKDEMATPTGENTK